MKQIHGVWLPENDEHFITHIQEDGSYQGDIFKTCMQYVTNPKLFFDVGAHVGLWSLMANKAGFKEIRAFEPNPETFKCLVSNISNIDNAHVHNYGLARRDGKIQIILEHPGNSGAVKLSKEPGTAHVRNINDDNIGESVFKLSIKPHETLIKIDTEGMEVDCILGMEKIIHALKPVIVIEQRNNEDALKLLKDMGMTLINNIRRDFILIWPSVTSTLSQSTMDAMSSWQK